MNFLFLDSSLERQNQVNKFRNGSCGWIRTNDTPIEDQRVNNDGTHIGTHEMWNELEEVAEKWSKLPKEIRDALLAIVRSVS